jgi:hypothetical protein
MPGTPNISLHLEGDQNIKAGLEQAPGLTNTFVRQVFIREGKRWRKTFKHTQLAGRPGIFSKRMRKLKDRNVLAFATGKFEGLAVIFKISRFLRWHTEGATIPVRGGSGTFHLPARLQFRDTVDRHIPPIVRDTGLAALRAMQVSLERSKGGARTPGLKNLRAVL